MAHFTAEFPVRCSRERAFEFLATPRNLPLVALPDVNLVIEEAPEQVSLGGVIRFSISAMGQVIRAAHEVIECEAPDRFVEIQIEGPFSSWRHEHRFQTLPDGRISIIDEIEFLPPKGLLGMLMNEKRIRAQLEEGFEHRQWKLEQLLNGTT